MKTTFTVAERIQQIIEIVLFILAGIFASLIAGVFLLGLALWRVLRYGI